MRIRITKTQLRRVIRESYRRMGSRDSSIRLLEDNHAPEDEYEAMVAAGKKAAKGYKKPNPPGPWDDPMYHKNPDMAGDKCTKGHAEPAYLDIREARPLLFGMFLEDAYDIYLDGPVRARYEDNVNYYTRKDVQDRIARAKKKFASTPKAKRDFEDTRYKWALWKVQDEGPPEAVIDDLALDLLRNVRKYAKIGVGRLAGRYRKRILELGMSKEDFDTAFGDAMTDGDAEVSDRFYKYKGDDLPHLMNDLVSKIYR